MTNRVALVVGAGPGVGLSVARRWAREGYDVALVSRDAEELESRGRRLQSEGVTAGWSALDICEAEALSAAVTRFGEHAGRLDVVHFNPSAFRPHDPLTLTAAELLADVGVGVAPLLTLVQAARPFMPAGARVTATGGGAADKPWRRAASLGVQKAGLRNLVGSLDASLAPHGVRAVSVTVNGTLQRGTAFDPDRVAEAIVAAASRPDEGWTTEVPYNG